VRSAPGSTISPGRGRPVARLRLQQLPGHLDRARDVRRRRSLRVRSL